MATLLKSRDGFQQVGEFNGQALFQNAQGQYTTDNNQGGGTTFGAGLPQGAKIYGANDTPSSNLRAANDYVAGQNPNDTTKQKTEKVILKDGSVVNVLTNNGYDGAVSSLNQGGFTGVPQNGEVFQEKAPKVIPKKVIQHGHKHVDSPKSQKTTSVTGYQDNPDGTTTNYTADGGQDTGTYTQNSDGTQTFHPQSQSSTPDSHLGGSIVDYLGSIQQPSDFSTRTRLATENGIPNYTGTAAQNTQLLGILRSKNQPTQQQTGGSSHQTSQSQSGSSRQQSTQQQQVNTPTTTSASGESPQVQLLRAYGYDISPSAAASFKMAPAKSFQEVYAGVAQSLGISSVKSHMDDVTKKMNTMDQELADKTADINENPWLTEGVRVSQIQKLKDRYDLKRGPFESDLKIYEDMYKTAREEAQYVATGTLNEYNKERDFQRNELDDWVNAADKLMQAQIKASKPQSQSELYGTGIIGEYNYAKANGYTGSFSAYQNEDANRKRPVTRVTVMTEGDKEAGSAADTKQRLLDARGSDNFVDPYLYQGLRASSRLSPTDFDGRFKSFVNPDSYERLGFKTGGRAL